MDNQAADRIRALQHHPGWPDLIAEAEAKRLRWEHDQGRLLLAQKVGDGPEQAQLDFWRGHFDGLRWLLSQPDKAQKQLSQLEGRETKEAHGR